MKSELCSLYRMKKAMAKEHTDFIENQSDKIALRAIDRKGLMVGREFDDYKSAVGMARDSGSKAFCMLKLSSWRLKTLSLTTTM